MEVLKFLIYLIVMLLIIIVVGAAMMEEIAPMKDTNEESDESPDLF